MKNETVHSEQRTLIHEAPSVSLPPTFTCSVHITITNVHLVSPTVFPVEYPRWQTTQMSVWPQRREFALSPRREARWMWTTTSLCAATSARAWRWSAWPASTLMRATSSTPSSCTINISRECLRWLSFYLPTFYLLVEEILVLSSFSILFQTIKQ